MTSPEPVAGGSVLDVQYSHQPQEGSDPPPTVEVRRILRAVLPAGAEVTVRFVDAEDSRALNSRHLGKNRPANVLAFPYEEEGRVAGDVAICPEVVAKEARHCGVPASERYAHLLVHAALHLQGMEHDTPSSARTMERAEARLLASLGFADPYAQS